MEFDGRELRNALGRFATANRHVFRPQRDRAENVVNRNQQRVPFRSRHDLSFLESETTKPSTELCTGEPVVDALAGG